MPVKKLIEHMHGKRAKATVIFYYARLRDAIPKVWVKHLKDDSSLIIPPVFVVTRHMLRRQLLRH